MPDSPDVATLELAPPETGRYEILRDGGIISIRCNECDLTFVEWGETGDRLANEKLAVKHLCAHGFVHHG